MFMWVVRPLLAVLIMLISGIYIDAFSSETAAAREDYTSVAGDLSGIVRDILNRRDQEVRLRYCVSLGSLVMQAATAARRHLTA